MCAYQLSQENIVKVFFLCCILWCRCIVSGGDALVGSGVMESLIQVLEWKAYEPSNITVRANRHTEPHTHVRVKKVYTCISYMCVGVYTCL